jgi:hypothetical protein
MTFVAGDRAAWWFIQGEALRQFTAQAQNVTGARLHIGGFPFVTQLMAGRLGHVTGSAHTATLGQVSVSDVSVDAYGVQTTPPYTIDHGVAWGNVSMETLTGLINDHSSVKVTVTAHDGMLTIQTSLLGLIASVDVVPRVVARDSVGIDAVSAHLGSQAINVRELPLGIGDAVQSLRVGFHLPDRVSVDAVTVLDGSLRIQISGQGIIPGELVGS